MVELVNVPLIVKADSTQQNSEMPEEFRTPLLPQHDPKQKSIPRDSIVSVFVYM